MMMSDIDNLLKLKKKNNKYLINILSYFIFFLSNLVFLILIPSELNKVFFFKLFNCQWSIFIFYSFIIFTKKNNRCQIFFTLFHITHNFLFYDR